MQQGFKKPHKRKLTLLMAMLAVLTVFLAACSNKPITEHSTGIWDGLVILNFSRAIIWLANFFGNSYGMGIIAFTLIIRIIILPLMIYQSKTMLKTQELQPELKKLQQKYPGKDNESRMQMQKEQQKLYAQAGVNPFAGCLPIAVQMPILIALYQAIWRTQELRTGDFLWLKLGSQDPYFILPILAAAFTLISSWLAMASSPEQNGMTKAMTFGMPLIIFGTALTVPSALSLYWVVSNAFQVVQTWFIQNPFKINAARAAKKSAEKTRQRKIDKAKRVSTKGRKK